MWHFYFSSLIVANEDGKEKLASLLATRVLLNNILHIKPSIYMYIYYHELINTETKRQRAKVNEDEKQNRVCHSTAAACCLQRTCRERSGHRVGVGGVGGH